MLTYLFHGPSGSGKDTQIERLNEKFSDRFQSIGTGDMFRQLAKIKGNPLAQKAKLYVDRGEWVPDEITYELFKDWITRYDADRDWIFVSVVRVVSQIPLFDNVLKSCDRELDAFIHFKIVEEVAIERISLRWYCPVCGSNYHEKYKPEEKKGYCDKDGEVLKQRKDDNPRAIIKRLATYNRTIEPILKVYRGRGKFIEVNANLGIEEINESLIEKLGL